MTNASGCVLDIDFAEKSGAVAGDASRYGNEGSLNGCKWVEHGLEFNGSSDYVDCGNDASLDITDAITIGVWMKTSKTDHYVIINKRTSAVKPPGLWELWYFSGHGLRFDIGNNASSGDAEYGAFLNDDKWHYIVGMYNDPDMTLYVDGIEKASGGLAGMTINTENIYIGSRKANSQHYFNGSIDQVRICNYALNASEIKAHYDSTKHIYR